MSNFVDEDELSGLDGDERIVEEAKSRFEACRKWEAEARQRSLEDLRFSCGDSDNNYQWPDNILQSRDVTTRVTLTLNVINSHCLQIENDARKNKPSVNIRPTGNGATYEAAQIFEGIVRHIEYRSSAQSHYMTAVKFQVRGGIGYCRLVTDYVGPDTFDQEIYIKGIKDPMTVYLDPNINEPDGLDANYGFIHIDMPKDEFRAKFKDHADIMLTAPLGGDGEDSWVTENNVRVCEYFRKVRKKDKLIQAINPENGEVVKIRRSKSPKDVWDQLAKTLDNKIRDVEDISVEWVTIAGHKVIDKREWLGCYIPIFRCVGQETIIDKKLDRKGHVRLMKDAQRQYNYWASTSTEAVALQPIQPWLVAVDSTTEFENYYAMANRNKYAALPFRAYDSQGRSLPAPERMQPAQMPEALMRGMDIAHTQIMMISGQFQAQMGAPSNERSGKAIQERQAQGDTSTYHYNDGSALMIRAIGKALIDLIPKIYDTARVIKILAEDKTQKDVEIDPMAAQAYIKKQSSDGRAVKEIFNPNVGTYEVEADIGPDYATKRQEAYNALTQLMIADPGLMAIAGDICMRSADFPNADELAERLKRMVPPQALGEGPPPQLQEKMSQLQQQNQSLTNTITEMTKSLAEKDIKIRSHAEQKDINVYKAETERMSAIARSMPDVDPGIDLKQIISQTLREMSTSSDMSDILNANKTEISMQGVQQ